MTISAMFAVACVLSFAIGGFVGDKFGWLLGVLEGYGAAKWPDAPTFAKARKIINGLRGKDGLPLIGEESKP